MLKWKQGWRKSSVPTRLEGMEISSPVKFTFRNFFVPTRLEGMEISIHRNRFENASPVPTRLEGMEIGGGGGECAAGWGFRPDLRGWKHRVYLHGVVRGNCSDPT